jgi:hypothetical protein
MQQIENRIYIIRKERVMLDFDVAELYEVEMKVLTEAVENNKKRFTAQDMFRLTSNEWQNIQLNSSLITQNNAAPPYTFNANGVTLLSGILNSNRAIAMNISIIRTFTIATSINVQQLNLKTLFDEIKHCINNTRYPIETNL